MSDISLDERMKRLDIMCDVLTQDLMKKKTISKATIRGFLNVTAAAVTQYLEEQNDKSAS